MNLFTSFGYLIFTTDFVECQIAISMWTDIILFFEYHDDNQEGKEQNIKQDEKLRQGALGDFIADDGSDNGQTNIFAGKSVELVYKNPVQNKRYQAK